MGKSIRSKVKRANRTQLRKDFSDPIVKLRQDKIAKKMAEDLKERNGGSILGLRSALTGGKKEDDMDEDAEEDEEDVLEKPANPYAVQRKEQAMNPFGHMNRKAKAGAPNVVMAERLKEKAIKKANEQAIKEGKIIKPKSSKKMTWFK